VTGTVQREQLYVYDVCQLCVSDEQVLVYERDDQLLCAEHTRRCIAANPQVQSCDRCGSARNILRDPSHRRNEYLCLDCHKEDGFTSNDTVTGRAVRSAVLPPKLARPKVKCEAAGYGSKCDDNVKPRNAWGGKSLCNTHGKTPPAREKKVR
jgi:hypothetical protein